MAPDTTSKTYLATAESILNIKARQSFAPSSCPSYPRLFDTPRTLDDIYSLVAPLIASCPGPFSHNQPLHLSSTRPAPFYLTGVAIRVRTLGTQLCWTSDPSSESDCVSAPIHTCPPSSSCHSYSTTGAACSWLRYHFQLSVFR